MMPPRASVPDSGAVDFSAACLPSVTAGGFIGFMFTPWSIPLGMVYCFRRPSWLVLEQQQRASAAILSGKGQSEDRRTAARGGNSMKGIENRQALDVADCRRSRLIPRHRSGGEYAAADDRDRDVRHSGRAVFQRDANTSPFPPPRVDRLPVLYDSSPDLTLPVIGLIVLLVSLVPASGLTSAPAGGMPAR